MISRILLKGVEMMFDNDEGEKSSINERNIKRDLSTVIRSKRDISQSRIDGGGRLKKYLEKEERYQGVIRRSENSRSKSKRGKKQETHKKEVTKETDHKSSFDKSYWLNVIRTSQNSIT